MTFFRTGVKEVSLLATKMRLGDARIPILRRVCEENESYLSVEQAGGGPVPQYAWVMSQQMFAQNIAFGINTVLRQ